MKRSEKAQMDELRQKWDEASQDRDWPQQMREAFSKCDRDLRLLVAMMEIEE